MTLATALAAGGLPDRLDRQVPERLPALAREDPSAIPPGYRAGSGWSTRAQFELVDQRERAPPKFGASPATTRQTSTRRQGRTSSASAAAGTSRLLPDARPQRAPWREGAQVRRPQPAPRERHEGTFGPFGFPKPKSFNEADVSTSRSSSASRGSRARAAASCVTATAGAWRACCRWTTWSRACSPSCAGGTSSATRSSSSRRTTGSCWASTAWRASGCSTRRARKVPMIMRGPGLEEGAVHAQPTGNIDVTATIYDAVGVDPPRSSPTASRCCRSRAIRGTCEPVPPAPRELHIGSPRGRDGDTSTSSTIRRDSAGGTSTTSSTT